MTPAQNQSFKLVRPWNPAFDMPHNREQALAVLRCWANPSTMTFSARMCERIHHLLTTDTPKQIAPQFQMHCGRGEGWVFVVEAGHFGYFDNMQQAQEAYAAAKGK